MSNNPAQAFYNWYTQTIRNSKYRWLIIAGSLLYLLSPIDIAPDFIPILGWIDDGLLATLLVTEVSQMLLGILKSSEAQAKAQADTAEAPTIDVTPQ